MSERENERQTDGERERERASVRERESRLAVQCGLDLPQKRQPALVVPRPAPPLQRPPLHLVPL